MAPSGLNTQTAILICDNPEIIIVDFAEACPIDYYKGAMAIDDDGNDTDYHFYRQNTNGEWSHKSGYTKVVDTINVEINGKNTYKKICKPDGIKSNRYKNFCNYFCIPKNDKSKTKSVSHSNVEHGDLKH